jgi:putative ABC transport system substrate-binding protein
MRRREFLGVLAGAATWPIVARGQQARRLPIVGYVGAATASAQSRWTAAHVQRLRELGWIEGSTVTIEYRWAEGRSDRPAEIAAEFIHLKVDVIVAAGTIVAVAAKQATSTIPIIFPLAGDPVENGLVVSLARPGGNVSGISVQQADTASKRIELLREVVPTLRRLAIMANADYSAALLEMREAQKAARTLGIDVEALEIQKSEDITHIFETLSGRVEGLYVCGDPLVDINRARINSLALGARLPTMYPNREYVEAAGLMSYGPNYPDLFRRAAELVDKILRGAKPADLPVEQPTRFDLVVNLITAKALGLTVPRMLLGRADEVIE